MSETRISAIHLLSTALVSTSAALVLTASSMVAVAQPAAPRTTVLISDTHMGLGRATDGTWDGTEDFRWPEVLESFLVHVTARYGDSVDLVILGDFLELWQPPSGIACRGPSDDLGCTPAEALQIASIVVGAHARELTALNRFAARGENRLVLVPGNHDSALLLDNVWSVVGAQLGAASGRVELRSSGVWTSPDELVYAEHGHQIGRDANRYRDWPQITRARGDANYIVRPWGERFVQVLFNQVERDYPIIDNLSPESAGARYRFADRGLARSAADLARFLAFNLFETSIRQKAQILGEPCEGEDCPPADVKGEWDVAYARTLGAALFADSLPPDDPFRATIVENTAQGAQLRSALDALLRNELSDEDVRQLCDHASVQSATRCERATAGAALQRLVNTKEQVLRKHLLERNVLGAGAAFYVYGHTHQLETPWELELSGPKRITVANTGAFQRVIDETGFKRRVRAEGLAAKVALQTLTHDDLPACYTYVVVTRGANVRMQTLRWHQKSGEAGSSVGVGAAQCE